MDYQDAGVDVVAGRAFVDRIQQMVGSTRRPEVLGGLGGFGGSGSSRRNNFGDDDAGSDDFESTFGGGSSSNGDRYY